MYTKTHCFIKNIRLNQPVVTFFVDGAEVQLTEYCPKNTEKDGGMMLEIKEKVTPAELKIEKSEMDKDGLFIKERMKKYKSRMFQVATVIEGLFAIHYKEILPAFDLGHVMVNVRGENQEEERMIKDGEVTGGFGDIFTPEEKYELQLSDEMLKKTDRCIENLPALAFLTEAGRAQKRGNAELAFFLYFRILEGYYSDGTPKVERALHKNKNELAKYIPQPDKLREHIRVLLSLLKLPSRSASDLEAVISDLVLLRHKLTHFSKENSEKHFSTRLRFEMETLNSYLRITCIRILWSQID